MAHLDPHERPPDGIRNIYKKYQKMKLGDLEQDSSIVDLPSRLPASLHSEIRIVAEWRREDVADAFCAFGGEETRDLDSVATSSVPVYEHKDMPGRICCWIFNTSFVELQRIRLTIPFHPHP
jgi:alkylated DNA repair protein alkB family protein 1